MRTRNLHNKKSIILLLVLILAFVTSFAETTIKGKVKDALTKQPLQAVSVVFKGGKGVTTNTDGGFTIISSGDKNVQIEISHVGYKTKIIQVAPGKEQEIEVELMVADAKNTVVVKSSKRSKYSNKNNPAVELIRKVIDNKSKNRVSNYDYVKYEQYEKMELALTSKPEKLMNNKLMKNFQFVFENEDTTKIEGKSLLPVYLEEKSSQKYYRKNPEKEKTFVLGEKKVNFGEFIDINGISSYLNRLYEPIDIYDNSIPLLTNQFLSPIADLAPTFYRFYITDTVEADGIKLIRLSFTPKNLADLLFKGTMFITLDGNYSIQKMDMSISKHANLNFVRELKIKQDFEKGPDGRYHVLMSNTITEFALSKGASGGIMGERTVSFKNFTINKPEADSMYEGEPVVMVNNINNTTESFWVQHRQPQLTDVEAKVYSNIDSLQNMKSYKQFMDLATLVLAGYKQLGPNYEMGPVSTFYSFNPVEGFRLRFGGRSTPKFNKSIYFENYAAYGFKDQKWKYFFIGHLFVES